MLEVKQFITAPLHTNCFLIHNKDTKEGVIVDAGTDLLEQIDWYIKDWEISIQAILLTHSHWDHTAGLHALQHTYPVPTYVHRQDALNVTKPGSDGLPSPEDIFPASITEYLEDGQVLNLAGTAIQVLHTPGHSPGSVSFYIKEENTLLSGDTLFEGTCGNVSFPLSSPQAMVTSLKKLSTLPLETIVYPGHGEITTLFDEQWIADASKILS